MGKIILNSSRSIDGPWLLNQNKLEELSKVLVEIYLLLEEDYSLKIEPIILQKMEEWDEEKVVVSERINDIYGTKKRIIITSKSRKLKEYENFEKILMDKDLEDQQISELEIDYTIGYSSLKLRVSNGYNKKLDYTLNISNENIEEKALHILDRWVDKSKPNKIVQVWSKILGFHWVILYFVFYIYGKMHTGSEELYREHLENQALKILQNGIDNNSSNEALKILLEYQVMQVPESFKEIASNNNGWLVLSLLVLIGIMLQFCPKTNLAIGKGKERVKYGEMWIKVVTRTIPVFIVATFFSNLFNLFM